MVVVGPVAVVEAALGSTVGFVAFCGLGLHWLLQMGKSLWQLLIWGRFYMK